MIELLASGQFAGCTELTLWDNRLGDRGAEALVRCEDLARLRVLDLGWNQIGPDGARALATSRMLAQLERLNLYHNDILDAGVAALAGSAHLQPADLNLCRNGVGSRARSRCARRRRCIGCAVSRADATISGTMASPHLPS